MSKKRIASYISLVILVLLSLLFIIFIYNRLIAETSKSIKYGEGEFHKTAIIWLSKLGFSQSKDLLPYVLALSATDIEERNNAYELASSLPGLKIENFSDQVIANWCIERTWVVGWEANVIYWFTKMHEDKKITLPKVQEICSFDKASHWE